MINMYVAVQRTGEKKKTNLNIGSIFVVRKRMENGGIITKKITQC